MIGAAAATIRDFIGDPPLCGPDDRDTAQDQIKRLDAAIQHGGWTRCQQVRLYRLRAKWRRRADGQDLHYRLLGTAGGPIPRELRRRAAALRKSILAAA